LVYIHVPITHTDLCYLTILISLDLKSQLFLLLLNQSYVLMKLTAKLQLQDLNSLSRFCAYLDSQVLDALAVSIVFKFA